MIRACDAYFPGDRADSVSAWRRFATEAMAGLPCEVIDDGRLVASELATNAERHSRSGAPGGKFQGRIAVEATSVLIEVTDQGRDDGRLPEVLVAQGAAETGRGLWLCAALGEVDTERTPEGGCRVCVRLPIARGGVSA